jgi:hypothetical protein
MHRVTQGRTSAALWRSVPTVSSQAGATGGVLKEMLYNTTQQQLNSCSSSSSSNNNNNNNSVVVRLLTFDGIEFVYDLISADHVSPLQIMSPHLLDLSTCRFRKSVCIFLRLFTCHVCHTFLHFTVLPMLSDVYIYINYVLICIYICVYITAQNTRPKVAAEWLALMLCIRLVLTLNLGPSTGYPN